MSLLASKLSLSCLDTRPHLGVFDMDDIGKHPTLSIVGRSIHFV
jgi:hypothetical protein